MSLAQHIEQQGVQKGLEKGILQGLEKGELKGRAEVLAELLADKFGANAMQYLHYLRQGDVAQYKTWTRKAMNARSLNEVFTEQTDD